MQEQFQKLRNQAVITAVASAGVGAIVCLSPNTLIKTFGGWLAIGSIGSLASTQFLVDASEKISDRDSKRFTRKILELSKELEAAKDISVKLLSKLQDKDAVLQDKIRVINQLNQTKEELQELVSALRIEIDNYKAKITANESINSTAAIELLNESFDEFKSQIEGVCRTISRRYPGLKDWEKIAAQYQNEVDSFTRQIAVVASFTNAEELISGSLALQHEIIYRGSLLKIKIYKSVINHLVEKLNVSIAAEEHKQAIAQLDNVFESKIQAIKEHYSKNFEAIKREFGEFADNVTVTFNHDFKELCQQGLGDAEKIEALQREILELQQRVIELSKPHQFPTQCEQARVGNAIIAYYFKLGVTLDGIEWQTNETGYTLLFHTSRNGSRFISDEFLNDGDSPLKLKEVSGALNLPKFNYNPRGGCLSLEIQTRYPDKKTSTQDEINRLWKSASHFEKVVAGWSPRIRITGGSESGKSPTAENIAVCILKSRPGISKLYNPQHDSVKNYWTIPVVGTSHSDSEKAIAELAKKVDARSNGQESRELFELWIFDEIDSTMSHTKGKKSAIGKNVNFIIKQASHQNLGAIFIGQNANVSEYPGMDRSDWNNAVNVHIGANCYDAITNTNRLTSEEQAKLKAIADKLTEFCSTNNEELGLDKTDPSAYRFALVMESNKKPYFIELPKFGEYTYDQAEIADKLAEVYATDAQKPCKSVAENLPESRYIGVTCPKCQEGKLSPTTPIRGVNYYVCDRCGRKTSEKLLRR